MNEHIATISKFFAGNDIFVTGGTGIPLRRNNEWK